MAPTQAYVKPDSVLARTAREMLEAHAGGAGPSTVMTRCPLCGEPLPCSSGRAAAEVLFAAGLAESSGLVAASRQNLGLRPETLRDRPPVGPGLLRYARPDRPDVRRLTDRTARPGPRRRPPSAGSARPTSARPRLRPPVPPDEFATARPPLAPGRVRHPAPAAAPDLGTPVSPDEFAALRPSATRETTNGTHRPARPDEFAIQAPTDQSGRVQRACARCRRSVRRSSAGCVRCRRSVPERSSVVCARRWARMVRRAVCGRRPARRSLPAFARRVASRPERRRRTDSARSGSPGPSG